jgi:hypothetical protein
MLSDPRIGLVGSFIVAGFGALWLVALWIAGDELWSSLGYVSHAMTLLSIFAIATGLAVSLLFRRFARVKRDLLAGRNVLARWLVDPKEFAAFSPVAEVRDRAEKRSALIFILVLLALTFGAFSLYDPEAAPMMLSVGAAVAAAIVLAFLWGNRIRRKHLTLRTGEVIVGSEGLIFNGVLHVWGGLLSWLSSAELEKTPHPILTITYGYVARYGVQYVSVPLPVPPESVAAAEQVAVELNALAGRPTRRRRRKAEAPARRRGQHPLTQPGSRS